VTQYSYALFAHDSTPFYAIAATATSTTTAAGSGAVSGTVTDAGGTHHSLANVTVDVVSPSSSAFGSARTAADGSYTVSGLVRKWVVSGQAKHPGGAQRSRDGL
jgi:hypothetical protein